jgi:hypothetical protein
MAAPMMAKTLESLEDTLADIDRTLAEAESSITSVQTTCVELGRAREIVVAAISELQRVLRN